MNWKAVKLRNIFQTFLFVLNGDISLNLLTVV